MRCFCAGISSDAATNARTHARTHARTCPCVHHMAAGIPSCLLLNTPRTGGRCLGPTGRRGESTCTLSSQLGPAPPPARSSLAGKSIRSSRSAACACRWLTAGQKTWGGATTQSSVATTPPRFVRYVLAAQPPRRSLAAVRHRPGAKSKRVARAERAQGGHGANVGGRG